MPWVIDQAKVTGDYSGAGFTTASLSVTAIGAGHSLACFIQNANPSHTYTFGGGTGTYVGPKNTNMNAAGQELNSFYVLSLTGGPTTLTATDTTTNGLAFYSFAIIEFHWSAGGTPTFHGNAGAIGNSTAPNSGAATFTSGDLTIGAACGGNAPTGTYTAGTGFTLQNGATVHNYDYADEQGTTTGTASFTVGTNPWTCLALTFTPPGGCIKGSLAMMGAGCYLAAKKLEENPIMTRRGLIVPRSYVQRH